MARTLPHRLPIALGSPASSDEIFFPPKMRCWIPSGHLAPHGQAQALRQLRAHHRQISLESQSKVLPGIPPRLVQLQPEVYRSRMRQVKIAERATQQLRSSQHTRMLSLESRKRSEYAPSKLAHRGAGLRGRASAGKIAPNNPETAPTTGARRANTNRLPGSSSGTVISSGREFICASALPSVWQLVKQIFTQMGLSVENRDYH